MSFVTAWSPFFHAQARMRGKGLQLAKKITLLDPRDNELVRAEVIDDDHGVQTVTIQQEDKKVSAECTCAEFEKGTYCDHIWGVLQVVQKQDPKLGAQIAKLKVQPPKARKRAGVSQRPKDPEWMNRLSLLKPPTVDLDSTNSGLTSPRKLNYVVLTDLSTRQHGLYIEVRQCTPTASGWSKPKQLKLTPYIVAGLTDARDRRLCGLIMGATGVLDTELDTLRTERACSVFRLPPGLRRELLQELIATERCFLDEELERAGNRQPIPLAWGGDEPWMLWMYGQMVRAVNQPAQPIQPAENAEVTQTPSTQNELLINAELRRKLPPSPVIHELTAVTDEEGGNTSDGNANANTAAGEAGSAGVKEAKQQAKQEAAQQVASTASATAVLEQPSTTTAATTTKPKRSRKKPAKPSAARDAAEQAELDGDFTDDDDLILQAGEQAGIDQANTSSGASSSESPSASPLFADEEDLLAGEDAFRAEFGELLEDGAAEEEDEETALAADRGEVDYRYVAVDEPNIIFGGRDGLLIVENEAAPFNDHDAFRWASQFRDNAILKGGPAPLRIPEPELERFFDRLYLLPQLPAIDLPTQVGPNEITIEPDPILEIFGPDSPQAAEVLPSNTKNQVLARVSFRYNTQRITPNQAGRYVPTPPEAPGLTSPADTANALAEDMAKADADLQAQGKDDDKSLPALSKTAADLSAEEADDEARALAHTHQRTLIRRNPVAERRHLETALQIGCRPANDAGESFVLSSKQVPIAVSTLSADGWTISAEQRMVRTAGTPSLSIVSGIDWFELRGGVKFKQEDGTEVLVSLPEILAAANSGRQMIELADGSFGMLPEEWLQDNNLLATLGETTQDGLRFKSSQAAMLDAMLREYDNVETDEAFDALREKLNAFEGIEAAQEPDGFQGQLREYQAEGVGWFEFLRWFGVGGVLADDMGLGKTVQVLCMLQGIHTAKKEQAEKSDAPRMPSLIVGPRSVLFNWLDEAEKFTPGLRVLAYAGMERQELRDKFHEYDLVITTYGLMRRDIDELKQYRFEYVVLDEAQAIKNPASQSSKAARLIDANHRLALTGTPVENHLGDLWSIFEYLNPGMLGSQLRFAETVRNAASAAAQDDTQLVSQIGKALRPFILRRTKTQVLKDLPAKTEQTLICEMEDAQQAVYDEMKSYYRGSLMKQMDDQGVGGSGGVGRQAFMVLEALLRLRQAACHPGLIDAERKKERSAKCDVLFDRLADIIDEGSKALVFSQFTSMLDIIRIGLEERGIRYCYLDGQTRDRREVVDRFQNDDAIPVFLISLKAGGFGLNLTAAEYVFIMDPWWNPAVEAQAIDRTHRIGQTKPVFAYRMVCKDTVEQRILDLQQKKRELADAIVGTEQSPLQSLSRTDLENLLA